MTLRYSIINGQFLPAERAAIGVGDLSIQRGYGIFDFFRTVRGRPVFWEDHLDRLERSAAAMRLPLPFDRTALRAMLHELMQRNDLPDSGIRITVTGGAPADGYSIATPNVLITQQPLAVPGEPEPISLITHPHQRQLPQVKTIDYLMAIWLRPIIAEAGADDVLYHDGGLVTECPRNNVFLVMPDGTLVTPGRNILHGVTRRRVLRLAEPHVRVAERDVTRDELRTAREVFLTSTSKKLLPVVRIDGHPVGDGRVGKTTRFLAGRFDEQIRAEVGE